MSKYHPNNHVVTRTPEELVYWCERLRCGGYEFYNHKSTVSTLLEYLERDYNSIVLHFYVDKRQLQYSNGLGYIKTMVKDYLDTMGTWYKI